MDLFTATATTLLNATAQEWRVGLGATIETAHLNARRLVRQWHPDYCADPQAGDVFARIQKARAAWSVGGSGQIRTIPTGRGSRLDIRYRTSFTHELGETYIGARTLVTVYPERVNDLAQRAAQVARLFRFASSDMTTQMTPLLPQAVQVHTTSDQVVHVSARDPALVRLTDLTAYLGHLPARHVAWVGSGLWHLACYLQYAGVAHQAISPDHIWVDPRTHRVALLGGWAYALAIGDTWAALPQASVQAAPRALLQARAGDGGLDHILIRDTLRALLINPQGQLWDASTPDALVAFTRLPAGGTASAQYAAWKQALHTSFGPPKFVELDVSPSLIYPEN
jgi:hypothetical protein